MSFLLKDPDAVLDYLVDWGAEYLDTDALSGSAWSVVPIEPGGVTVVESGFDAKTATVTAEGGIPGHVYRLLNLVTLESGRIDSRSVALRVEKR